MKKLAKSKAIFLFLVLFYTATSTITFQKKVSSTQIHAYDLGSFEEVLVEAEFPYINSSGFRDLYLSIHSQHHSKAQAYRNLVKKYQDIAKTLIKMKAIPNEQIIPHSIIHKKFHKKSRKWEFIRYFVLYSTQKDIANILQKIRPYQPKLINRSPVVNYLSEKKMSMAAFTSAKNELEDFIKNSLNSQYKILLTRKIEIVGQKFQNEEIIEEDLERNFNKEESEDLKVEESNEELQYLPDKDLGSRKRQSIKIKVLFQLVSKDVDVEDFLNSSDSSSSDSDEEIWDEEDDSNDQEDQHQEL